ncbi:MAG TPA: adenylate/guanylate cyclase domain-containing protein [Chthoniobacterales bacterium]|nr:adenylate/guanylate cyclase domain-containing protein [Chthoniobacterales bacterium]
MKRHLTAAIVIGLIVGGLIVGLHMSGWLAGPERALADLVSRWGETTQQVPDLWLYVIAFLLAIGVALVTLATSRLGRMAGIVGILLVELLGVAWICSLFRVFFQPFPPMLAVVLGFLAPPAYLWLQEKLTAYLEERRSRPPKIKPAPVPRAAPIALVPAVAPEKPEKVTERVVEKVVEKPRARARRGDSSADAARVCEVTAVVCDLANKHDIAEECEPAMFADITERFIAHVTQALRAEGAYIESAGGEGVVAIFGYPESDKQHAEKATRKAMALTQSFSDSNKSSKVDALRNAGLHAGVSSGSMIMAPVKNNGQRNLLATGEPVELARRFCIANRFYGSRVLLGPRTFELASKILVARPIDFLSGVDVRERHEIYEPVALALNASREIITRRDAFWNGVVLYREKRWAEAYSQFQNARGPEGEEDRPLQLYLRRLEPLALQLTNTPLDE